MRPTIEIAPSANRTPVLAAIEPVAPPPAAANLGAKPMTRGPKARTRLVTGLARRRMLPEEVFHTVEGRETRAVTAHDEGRRPALAPAATKTRSAGRAGGVESGNGVFQRPPVPVEVAGHPAAVARLGQVGRIAGTGAGAGIASIGYVPGGPNPVPDAVGSTGDGRAP